MPPASSEKITKKRPIDGFEDIFLSDYPTKKIIQVSYSIEDYERIANATLAKIAAGRAEMASAVRMLVRLAYNTLLFPSATKHPGPDLFFQRHQDRIESWLQLVDRADSKLERIKDEEEEEEAFEDDDVLPKIKLRHQNNPSTNNQRKAAIGVWSICHLRAMTYPGGRLHLFFAKSDKPGKIISEMYNFENPYEFPTFHPDTYKLIHEEFLKHDPEVLYLFYRGAIILEHIFHEPHLLRDKKLLLKVAYGNPEGLRYHALELYEWFKSSARNLHIDLDELPIYLTSELKNGPNSKQLRNTILKLMEFHQKYHPNEKPSKGGRASTSKEQTTTSKYFMYARVLDDRYFSHLDANSNEELCSVLKEICRLKGESYVPNVNVRLRERAQLVANNICQEHAKQTSNNVNASRKRDKLRNSNQVNPSGARKGGQQEKALARGNSCDRVNQSNRSNRPRTSSTNRASSTIRAGNTQRRTQNDQEANQLNGLRQSSSQVRLVRDSSREATISSTVYHQVNGQWRDRANSRGRGEATRPNIPAPVPVDERFDLYSRVNSRRGLPPAQSNSAAPPREQSNNQGYNYQGRSTQQASGYQGARPSRTRARDKDQKEKDNCTVI